MRSVIVGVLVGGVVCLTSMLLLGAVHRYVYGPALAEFGDPAFFTDMSTWGIVALIAVRVFSAWLGSSVAVRLSNEPHATWTGPVVVMIGALTTLILMGLAQPIWSLLLSALVVFGMALAVGRSHVGLPVIPGLGELKALVARTPET